MPPSSGEPATGRESDSNGPHSTTPATTSSQWDLIWKPGTPPNIPSASRREEVRKDKYHYVEDTISKIESELVERELIPGPDERRTANRIFRLKNGLREAEDWLLDYTPRVSAFNMRLPYDIINMILSMVVLDDDVGASPVGRSLYEDTKRRLGRIRTLRFVCPYWNAIVMDSTQFWSSALYELPIRTSLSGPQWRDMCLALDSRRSTRLLHVVLYIGEGLFKAPVPPLPVLPSPEPEPPCSRPELAIQVWQPLIDLITTRATAITMEGTPFPYSHPPSLPKGLVNLKRLVLQNVHLLAEAESYLCETPNLEELWIEDCYFALPRALIGHLKGRVHLTRLRFFSYRASINDRKRTFNDPFRLLGNVALPALERVMLSYAPVGTRFPLHASTKGVRHLILGPYWRYSPIQIVAALPSLEELEINGVLAMRSNMSECLVIGHFLELLSNASIAPQLKTLVLRWCVFSQSNLLALFRGWRRDDCLPSRHVAFFSCDVWELHRAPKRMRDFVKGLIDQFDVNWVWQWDGRDIGERVAIVMDVEDREPGDLDYEQLEIGDELGEFRRIWE